MPKENKILDIISGIAQAAANGFDGALDEKGEPIKVGLKREEGHIVNSSRVADGFKINIYANQLCITYHSEIFIKDTHEKDFEDNLKKTINNIEKFLRSEYKKITGNNLKITPIKDKPMKSEIQCASRVRCWIVAKKWYKIGGINADEIQSKSDLGPEKSVIKKWLENVKKPEKPKNVKISKNANQKQ